LKKRTAKDFCYYWSRKYKEVVGKKFVINWMRDGSTFRNLISDFTNTELTTLIDFAFSGDPSTQYLVSQGFPIGLFPSQINKYNAIIENPGSEIPDRELELDLPVWDDSRTAYIYHKVMEGDLQSIIDNVENEYFWKLLIGKMERKNLGTQKVLLFYDMWQTEDTFERTRVKWRLDED